MALVNLSCFPLGRPLVSKSAKLSSVLTAVLHNSACMEIAAVVVADVDMLRSSLYDAACGRDMCQSIA